MSSYIYEDCSRHDSTVFSHMAVCSVTCRILCYSAWENKAELVVLNKTLHMHWQIKAEWRISHANVYVDKILRKLTLFFTWCGPYWWTGSKAKASGDLHGCTSCSQVKTPAWKGSMQVVEAGIGDPGGRERRCPSRLGWDEEIQGTRVVGSGDGWEEQQEHYFLKKWIG